MLLNLFNSGFSYRGLAAVASAPALTEPASAPPVATPEPPVATLKENGEPEDYRPDISLVLAEHRKWLNSRGESGTRAQLTGCSLCNLDLHGADLRSAFLRKVDLSGADLSLADFRGACLIQANLQKTHLLGARLQGAALQGAWLDGATRLLPGQLAGANLSGIDLPQPLEESFREQMKTAKAVCHRARQLLTIKLLACLGSSLLVFGITDLQIVANLPLLRLPLLAGILPANAFLLLGPLALLGLFLGFHLQLLRLWSAMAELPAVFPDGEPLDKKGPWLLSGLVRDQFQWTGDDRLPPSWLERAVLVFPAYWIVPAALLLFWGRYLTRLDLQGAIFQAGLLAASVLLATFLPRRILLLPRGEVEAPVPSVIAMARARLFWKAGSVAALGLLLCLLSFGTIHGVPHNSKAEDRDSIGVRGWAPGMLWMFGYSPYARFPEAQISSRPAGWSGLDNDAQDVRGPRLDGVSLRHAAAPGVFLANARLGEADLRNTDLTEADLRGADLHKAKLESASLDRARLNRANLQSASFGRASLVRANLREAELSYAYLARANLTQAVLTQAMTFAANLNGASLVGANLESADLRDSILENANLSQANLRKAYLWSTKLSGAQLQGAQLQNAFLIEADLRRAILRGADLQGAMLRDARFDGADLQAADLRGAAGLTIEQVCSARVRRNVLLDEDLAQLLATTCPP